MASPKAIEPSGLVSYAAVTAIEQGAGTRESWMLRAVAEMRPWFEVTEAVVPAVRVSVGWPGGRGKKAGVRGQCWEPSTVADGLPAIFVTPDQDDPATILGILLHEMIHASGARDHRTAFGKVAGPLGFLPKWTSSAHQRPELSIRLAGLAAALGPFPHARVNDKRGLLGLLRAPVQSTRMLKLACPEDGYAVRTTRKWIEVGLPSCPDGHSLEEVA